MSNDGTVSPVISIVVPCYNHGRFIQEAIESVEKCNQNSYELIIVNDGSTEPYTISILTVLEKKGYKIINQKNGGLGAARNAGIAAAKGKYILPLDSDNKIRPEYLTLSLEILESNETVGVVYGQAEYFGNKSGTSESIKFDIDRLLAGNYIDACAVFRRSVWQEVNGFETKMPAQGIEDWDFWLSVFENGWKFHCLEEIVFDYRVRTDSMIRTLTESENSAEYDETIDFVSKKHSRLLREKYVEAYNVRRRIEELQQRPLILIIKILIKTILRKPPLL